METITINSLAIGAAIGLVLGFVITKILNKSKGSSIVKDAERTAKNRVRAAHKEAESIKKDKILQAKERFIELKSEHEKVIQNREKKVVDIEKRLREKESQLASELDKNKRLNKNIVAKEETYNHKIEIFDKKQLEVEKIHKRQVEQLEVMSGLSAEDAKEELISSLKQEAKSDAMSYIQDIMEEAKLTAEQDARKVILNGSCRCRRP